jgi:hypothetical protein
MSNAARYALLIFVTLASATACSANSTTGTDSPARTAAGSGTLSGHLYTVGGPAPGKHRPLRGDVTVTGSGFAHDVTIGSDGGYSVAVPPGEYTVVGHSPDVNDGTTTCPAADKAQVTGGVTTIVDAVCQVK